MSTQSKKSDPFTEEQEQLLEEAKGEVERQDLQMRIALDGNRLMEALTYSSNMISELRTSLLSPGYYYQLYMQIFDNLRHLEVYIDDQHTHGKSLGELYEFVQFAGNILPRLYLLVTVGSVYIKSLEVPAKDVLRDLVEMCKGVQHPVRGLFLRNYLSEMTKDKLPDKGTKYYGFGGQVTDAIDFIMENFSEMNKLWVRLQHTAASHHRSRLEQERVQLGTLVGKNLSRLGQLEGLTIGIYRSDVLPKILNQITLCGDRLAQQYLMEIVVQGFSDELHLRTLDSVLESTIELVRTVDVPLIVSGLIDRLANFCEENPTLIPPDVDLFETFSNFILTVQELRDNEVPSLLNLIQSVLSLTLRVYKGNQDYVNQLFDITYTVLKTSDLEDTVYEKILEILKVPLNHYKDITYVLNLTSYPVVFTLLPKNIRKKVAREIGHAALISNSKITTVEHVDSFLQLLSPLYIGTSGEKIIDDEEFDGELSLVASVISLFTNENLMEMTVILEKAKDLLSEAGPARINYTLVPLVFKALALAQKAHKEDTDDWEEVAKSALVFSNKTIKKIADVDTQVLLALKLYLQCALVAGACGLGTVAFSFLTRGAYQIYEENLAKESQKYAAISLIISCITDLNCLELEDHAKLAKKTMEHVKLLSDQEKYCRALGILGNIFISETSEGEFREDKNIKRFLNSFSKIAQDMDKLYPDMSEGLLIELVDYCIFYEPMTEHVPSRIIGKIISLIEESFKNNETPTNSDRYIHLLNTKQYIKKIGLEID